MKKVTFGLLMPLFAVIITPLFASAAPALDSLPDEIKSKYNFIGEVNVVVTDGTTLYVGGSFDDIELVTPPPGDPPELTRANLAAIDLTTYELIADFNPRPNYAVKSIAIDGHGTLYVGGNFTCFGDWDEGEGICSGDTRNYLAAIDTDTGTVLSGFSPEPDGEVRALILNSDDSVLYAGGDFYAGDAEYVAAYTTADRTATAFDAGLDDTVNALALSSDDSTLYATGDFTVVNDTYPQPRLAAFDADTGDVITGFSASVGEEFGNGGYALALSSDDEILYIGGDFQVFSQTLGEGMPFDEATQEPVAVFPKISTSGGGGGGETVHAAIPDGDGGWYIGGTFTNVGTTTQESLAHITADGLYDGAFNPSFTDDATINALELSPDGTVLYAGGWFHAGDEQHLAAFNTSDGSLTAFDPYPDGTVYALALSSDGETLYVGTSLGVVAFDTTGEGTSLDFDSQTDSDVTSLALNDAGTTLYVGGYFTHVNTETTNDVRNRIAAFDTTGEGTMTAFDPNADGTVHVLVLSDDETMLYVGGSFENIGGETRVNFAEIDVSDGTATELDVGIPEGEETVYAIGVSTDEATIYLGGYGLNQVGGQPRDFFAEIDPETGAVTDFDPHFNGAVLTIAVDSGEAYIGGSFTGTESAVLNLIAVDTSDGSLISAFNPEPADPVRALALSSDDALLYAGGDFTDVNDGTARDHLAAFDTTDGDATAFNPAGAPAICDEDPEVCLVYGMALSPDDTELFVASYDGDDTGYTPILVFDEGDVVVGDDDDDDDDGDNNDDGGGSGSSSRVRTHSNNPLVEILTKLITVLQELIALKIAQQ